MGSIQREVRPSMQREDPPAMTTELERIAAKARSEPKLRFTSLAHHITRERVWRSLNHIPIDSAPGVDGQWLAEAKQNFDAWIEPMLQSMHRRGYQAPAIRRVYIPKPGKQDWRCCEPTFEERSAGNLHAAFCGSRRWVTASGDPVCALQAHEVQSPEMVAAVKPSQQPRTESCVRPGNGPCEA